VSFATWRKMGGIVRWAGSKPRPTTSRSDSDGRASRECRRSAGRRDRHSIRSGAGMPTPCWAGLCFSTQVA
jgi:hypothetical protein